MRLCAARKAAWENLGRCCLEIMPTAVMNSNQLLSDNEQQPFVLEIVRLVLQSLYYYMRNFYNLIGSEQWYFSLI